MANYYTDIPELKFHLNNPMMKKALSAFQWILNIKLMAFH